MGSSLLDPIFPQFCLGCGFVGAYICPSCEKSMKKIEEYKCIYCNKTTLLGLTHPSCRHHTAIDGLISVYSYTGLFRKVLHQSKYKGSYMALKTLLCFFPKKIIADLHKWNVIFSPAVVCVPLHQQRINERGFNQSELIREYFFNKDTYVHQDILKRTINTAHLANIQKISERKKSVKGAFTIIGQSIPEAVVLVDDVVTSGETIYECGRKLKEWGVQTVLAFSLAKG